MHSMSSYFYVNLQGTTTIFMITSLHCNIMILGKAKFFLFTTIKCQCRRYLFFSNGNLSQSFDRFVCSIAIVCLLRIRLRITTWLKKVFSDISMILFFSHFISSLAYPWQNQHLGNELNIFWPISLYQKSWKMHSKYYSVLFSQRRKKKNAELFVNVSAFYFLTSTGCQVSSSSQCKYITTHYHFLLHLGKKAQKYV